MTTDELSRRIAEHFEPRPPAGWNRDTDNAQFSPLSWWKWVFTLDRGSDTNSAAPYLRQSTSSASSRELLRCAK